MKLLRHIPMSSDHTPAVMEITVDRITVSAKDIATAFINSDSEVQVAILEQMALCLREWKNDHCWAEQCYFILESMRNGIRSDTMRAEISGIVRTLNEYLS